MLYHESRGAGPDLVMVHGWGMHSAVWSDWADSLATRFRVHLVDLPGHGRSDYSTGSGLDDWSAAVAEVAPPGACWLGWSLGGLVTLNAARLYPQMLRGLVLVASTPRFVTAQDWPCAVDAQVFEQFAGQLQQSVERTLVRFLSLQVRGADGSAELLRRLRTALKERPQPPPEALHAGLQLLRNSDLRATLSALDIVPHWLFGQRDTLVPASVGSRLPGLQAVIEGAGHAPFLSRPQLCSARVTDWVMQAATASGRHASG